MGTPRYRRKRRGKRRIMANEELKLTEQEVNALGSLAGEINQAQSVVERATLAAEGLIGRFARTRNLSLLDYAIDFDKKAFVAVPKAPAEPEAPTPAESPKED